MLAFVLCFTTKEDFGFLNHNSIFQLSDKKYSFCQLLMSVFEKNCFRAQIPRCELTVYYFTNQHQSCREMRQPRTDVDAETSTSSTPD